MSEPTKEIVRFLPARPHFSAGIAKESNGTDHYLNGTWLAALQGLKNEMDGLLWADATNVYTETGLTPSQLAEQRAYLLAEMKRYLPILEAIEGNPELWERLTARHGIATANGYRNAIAKATSKT